MKFLKILLLCVLVSVPSAQAVEIAFEADPSLPVVYLNVAVKTGSVSDPQKKGGLTQFLGRIMLRGTVSRTKEQIDLALDEMGAQLGVETRAESLIFRGAALSEKLDDFLALVLEVIAKPSFPESEIRKLRSEMQSELLEDMGEDRTIANKWFQRTLFNGHPYGNLVSGSIKDIKGISKADLESHYNDIVRSKNILVVGTGQAEFSRVKAWANKVAEQRPGQAQVAKFGSPEFQKQRKLVLVDKPDRTQVQIFSGHPGILMTDPDFFPLFLGNHAFGGGSFQARMMVEIRVQRGWSYSAYSTFRYGSKPHSWMYWFMPASKYAPEALAYSGKMLDTLKDKGITESEFQFARSSLINNSGFKFNTPQKRVENILIERTLGLPPGFIKSYGDKLSQVTLTQVNNAIRKFVRPEAMTTVVLGTMKDLKDPLIQATGIDPKNVEVVKYTD